MKVLNMEAPDLKSAVVQSKYETIMKANSDPKVASFYLQSKVT